MTAQRRTWFAALVAAWIAGSMISTPCVGTPLAAAATARASVLTTWTPTPDPLTTGQTSSLAVGAASRRVIALERQAADLEAEAAAIDTRIDVMQGRLYEQKLALDTARSRLKDAQQSYEDRVVAMYKQGSMGLLSLMLSALSFDDLVSRSMIASRIMSQDRSAIDSTRLSAAQLAYQQVELQQLRAQDIELRHVKRDKLARIHAALDKQRALLASLSSVKRRVVSAVIRSDARGRADWRRSSVPLDAVIPKVTCTVDPHTETFLCPSYQPRHYRATGTSFSAAASWYGPGFNGRPSASGQVYNMNDFTCASRTLPFGTRLALTRGDRRIVVVVNDRGPYVEGRDLDLSYAAAQALGFSGVATLQAEVVERVD
jgi:rare lipoprotein A (peptidoglycan hydrolase)